jgi:hypothetical protein
MSSPMDEMLTDLQGQVDDLATAMKRDLSPSQWVWCIVYLLHALQDGADPEEYAAMLERLHDDLDTRLTVGVW